MSPPKHGMRKISPLKHGMCRMSPRQHGMCRMSPLKHDMFRCRSTPCKRARTALCARRILPCRAAVQTSKARCRILMHGLHASAIETRGLSVLETQARTPLCATRRKRLGPVTLEKVEHAPRCQSCMPPRRRRGGLLQARRSIAQATARPIYNDAAGTHHSVLER